VCRNLVGVPRNRRDVAPVVFTFGTDAPAHAADFGLVRDTRPGGMMWLAQGSSEETGEESAAARRLMPQDALKIRGAHNAANALAALALCSAELPAESTWFTFAPETSNERRSSSSPYLAHSNTSLSASS
jgi:hypothetical protein